MIALLALAAAVAHATPRVSVDPEPVPTVITNVAVMDSNGHVGARQDVILDEGRIVAIEDVGSGWETPGLHVVDGSSHTLVPGLIDTHVHVASTFAVPGRVRIPKARDNLALMLYAGITTALDLSMERDAIDRLTDKIARGKRDGPTLHRSGQPYTTPGGHPMSSVRALFPGLLVRLATANIAFTVETSDDVDAAVSRQGQTGFKKIMLDSGISHGEGLSDDAAMRLAVAATALGDRLIAHVGTPDDVDRALLLGVEALAHAPSHGALSEEQARQLAIDGVPVMPTLAVWSLAASTHTGTTPLLPMESEVLSRRQTRDLNWSRGGHTEMREPMAEWAEHVQAAAAERTANVRLMRDNGVTLLVGSDSPNLATPAGAGLHAEMAHLLDAGLERSAILKAVTWDNSRFLDEDARFGAIRLGWEADLLLVEGNPEHDLAALQRISAMWIDGRRVQRDER